MEPRFFQKDIETMKRADIEALQLRRLKWMGDYCYNNVPFYHERLGQAGITSGDKIKALSDIQYIPFTTKNDIRDNYPFGMLAVPMKDIVRIHASSGTTGSPRTTSSRSPLAMACSPVPWACTLAWKKWAPPSSRPLPATRKSS